MELLNLDELVKPTRKVAIKGKEYTIADQTVGQMIEAIRVSKEVDGKNPEVIFEAMVRTAKAVLPDCPEKVLNGMSIRQLNALIEFASASDQQVVEGAEKEGKGEGKTK